MTTITSQGHQIFKTLSNNAMFRKHVKSSQGEVIKGAIISVLISPTEPQLSFVKKVIQLHKKYYLYCDSGDFLVVTKDFKGIVKFNIRKPNVKFKQHFNSQWMVEIDNLHSLKKGYGKMLLEEVLLIANEIKCEVCLWTENESNADYFKKFGFESYGHIGDAKENLMIRKLVK
ncbi:GNAT family N-acetyltransferase [Staphylococcus chromogenes]|uniref:GNAT family N-acetyltransferase n=1 Tax=Staphylococcus chromogenes TaxID=46126 RepID=UPI001E5197BC|nr:GNAT family N-acetyltransferase [Staphylococcus chromogenes]MCD8905027.1 GNAT family N-acetyltransferase [Staphylococcus chromogenes]